MTSRTLERIDHLSGHQYGTKGSTDRLFEKRHEAPDADRLGAHLFGLVSREWASLGVSLLLQADNIFDVTGRRHTSFTKDFVSLAGRNFMASVRMSF